MNDTLFTHAFNIVLVLDQNGCLKQDANLADPKNNHKLAKPCNRQVEAIRIIYAFLCQLYPDKSKDSLTQELYPNERCPHCRSNDIN